MKTLKWIRNGKKMLGEGMDSKKGSAGNFCHSCERAYIEGSP